MQATAQVPPVATTLTAFHRVVLVLGLLSQGMGQTMLFAILPPVARDLSLSELDTSLIITVSALFFMITTPFWGRLTDRWGRKPVFVSGLVFYGITTLAFTAVIDAGYRNFIVGGNILIALIIARAGFGILTGGIQTGANAMMADTTTAARRTAGIALIGASFGIGAVLGPALVSVLAPFGILNPLYAVSGLTLVMAALAAVALPETAHVQTRSRQKLSSLDPRIWPILLMSLATFLCVSMHNQSFGFYLQDLLQTTAQDTARNTGFGYIAIGLAMVFAQGVVVQWLKPSPALLLRAGPVIAAAGYLFLLQAQSIEMIVVAMAATGFGTGLLQAGVFAAGSLRVTPDEQGAAAGLLAAAPAGGFLLGPSISAALYTISHTHPFIANAVVLGVLAVAAWYVRVGKISADA